MTMQCQAAQPLIPGYLDGELSDAQAAPLRRHLLDCPSCRAEVQEMKTLRAWFVEDDELAVPAGFAARVARRALAGDTGSSADVFVPRTVAPEAQGRLLEFVLHLTAVAALVLFSISLSAQRHQRPDGIDLQAQDGSLLEALDRLDALNLPEVPPPGDPTPGEVPPR